MPAVTRTQRRVERIRTGVPILRLLEDFGYQVRSDMDREQQFPCDLHGDGQDTKPSARVYPGSESWYCFACDKSRDAIETVREKRGLGFMEALRWLETRLGLAPLPWEPPAPDTPEPSLTDEIDRNLQVAEPFEADVKRMQSFLDALTLEQDFPMMTILGFWEAFDKVVYLTLKTKPVLSEQQGKVALGRIRERVFEKMQEHDW